MEELLDLISLTSLSLPWKMNDLPDWQLWRKNLTWWFISFSFLLLELPACGEVNLDCFFHPMRCLTGKTLLLQHQSEDSGASSIKVVCMHSPKGIKTLKGDSLFYLSDYSIYILIGSKFRWGKKSSVIYHTLLKHSNFYASACSLEIQLRNII